MTPDEIAREQHFRDYAVASDAHRRRCAADLSAKADVEWDRAAAIGGGPDQDMAHAEARRLEDRARDFMPDASNPRRNQ